MNCKLDTIQLNVHHSIYTPKIYDTTHNNNNDQHHFVQILILDKDQKVIKSAFTTLERSHATDTNIFRFSNDMTNQEMNANCRSGIIQFTLLFCNVQGEFDTKFDKFS